MDRRLAGASALLALALAGCGSSQTSSSTTAPAPPHSAGAPHATAARCRPAQLALSYAGTEGATGHMELTVAVRNTSRAVCELRGYPGARLIGGAGRPLPLHVVRGHGFFPDTEPVPRRVALKPGASAHIGISFVTNNEYKGARVCRTATAAMLSTPGSATHWQRVSLHAAPRISPCGDQLVVSPVHA
ncbi:MAG: DUF4232 domain-containing protein [Solirubrobacteraceae bacterium]